MLCDLPTGLNHPRFAQAWVAWLEHRKNKNAVPPAHQQHEYLYQLKALGLENAVVALHQSIGGGHFGIPALKRRRQKFHLRRVNAEKPTAAPAAPAIIVQKKERGKKK